MNFYSVTLEKTVLFYKGGEFTAHENWKHKRMFHKGDYEIILCVKGPIYIQLDQEQYVINAGEVLLIPPFINFLDTKTRLKALTSIGYIFFKIQRIEN